MRKEFTSTSDIGHSEFDIHYSTLGPWTLGIIKRTSPEQVHPTRHVEECHAKSQDILSYKINGNNKLFTT